MEQLTAELRVRVEQSDGQVQGMLAQLAGSEGRGIVVFFLLYYVLYCVYSVFTYTMPFIRCG